MDKSDSGDGVSQSGDSGGADDGADPEVTAITRKLNNTGDTLGAIHDLEQLIIKRTGAIPIIRTDASPEPAVEPEPEPASPEIDWSIPEPPQIDDEPTFSPWVDPQAIAAAQDDAPIPSYSDVTTQVFAVFSADRDEPQPEPEPAPEPEPTPIPVPLPTPLADPTASLDVTPPPQLDDLDDDDVIDDDDHAALAGLVPMASAPAPATATPAPAPPEPPKRRRFWLFGRR